MKTRNLIIALVLASAFSMAPHSQSIAQTTGSTDETPVAASAPTAVPLLVPYPGAAIANDGKPVTGETGLTFQIYKDEVGGEAVWTETQTVAIDPTGHYRVQLGATNPNGLPSDLFATGEARWLAVQIAGQNPQPRVLIASVPYALKAADAATLGGLPASAFALAGRGNLTVATGPSPVTSNATTDVTTTGGTANNLAKFSGSSTIVDSILFDNGTEIGIGTSFPAATLDVRGTTNLHGGASVYNESTATTSAGSHSYGLDFLSSVYDSSTKAAVKPLLEFRAEPTGNDTATPGSTLNLLSSNGIAGATETGFYFNANGTINFAPGQTFPGGTGTGTITGVTAGTALTGGGTTGNVTLNLNLNQVPLLTTNNSFTGNQTVNGNLTVTGSIYAGLVSGTVSAGTVNATNAFDLGGQPFAFGSFASSNVYLGFAGNSSATNTGGGNNRQRCRHPILQHFWRQQHRQRLRCALLQHHGL